MDISKESSDLAGKTYKEKDRLGHQKIYRRHMNGMITRNKKTDGDRHDKIYRRVIE